MEPPGLKSGVPRGGILERPLSILALIPRLPSGWFEGMVSAVEPKGKDFGRESIKPISHLVGGARGF